MKKNKVLDFVCFLLAFVFVSFNDPYLVKRISDANYRYEFYTTDKKVRPKKDKMYYWFKGGLIHNAQSGISGELLHGKFIKSFHSNQLAEQGSFRNGLKVGVWKTWYPNGILESKQSWSNGIKSGKFYHYDDTATLLESGSYTNNMKFGKWIDYSKNDTLMYNHDKVVPKKTKKAKLKKEENKIDDSTSSDKESIVAKEIKTTQNKKQETTKSNTNKNQSAKETKKVEKKSTKESFFKRLFKKKTPKPIENDKSK